MFYVHSDAARATRADAAAALDANHPPRLCPRALSHAQHSQTRNRMTCVEVGRDCTGGDLARRRLRVHASCTPDSVARLCMRPTGVGTCCNAGRDVMLAGSNRRHDLSRPLMKACSWLLSPPCCSRATLLELSGHALPLTLCLMQRCRSDNAQERRILGRGLGNYLLHKAPFCMYRSHRRILGLGRV